MQRPTEQDHRPERRMTATDSFDALMNRLRAGQEAAAGELFHRFVHRLLAVARSRLTDRLRGKVDPEDVLQSVFLSFFRRHRKGQFALTDWDGVWGILVVITLRKCGNHVEYFGTARRDVGREVHLPPSAHGQPGPRALARDPTPAEAAVLADTLDQLMRGLA